MLLGVVDLLTPHNAQTISSKIRDLLVDMGWDGSGEVTMTTESAMVMCKAAQLGVDSLCLPYIA